VAETRKKADEESEVESADCLLDDSSEVGKTGNCKGKGKGKKCMRQRSGGSSAAAVKHKGTAKSAAKAAKASKAKSNVAAAKSAAKASNAKGKAAAIGANSASSSRSRRENSRN
jgi:hypothetical protein